MKYTKLFVGANISDKSDLKIRTIKPQLDLSDSYKINSQNSGLARKILGKILDRQKENRQTDLIISLPCSQAKMCRWTHQKYLYIYFTLKNFGHQKFQTFLFSDTHLSENKNVRNFL